MCVYTDSFWTSILHQIYWLSATATGNIDHGGVSGNTARLHQPHICLSFLKKIESTCSSMKTGILEDNAKDGPNYDVT